MQMDLRLILLLQLGCLLHIANSHHSDSNTQEGDSESESEEYSRSYPHMHAMPVHHHSHHHSKQHHHETRRENSHDDNVCNKCICNMCDNDPPDCCKKVCDNCQKQLSDIVMMPPISLSMPPMQMPPMTLPLMRMPPIQAIPMPPMRPPMPIPMPQMPMPQMSMPSMPMPPMQYPMSMVPMQQIPMPAMQMPSMSMSYSSPGVMFLHFPSYSMNSLKNMSVGALPLPKLVHPTDLPKAQLVVTSTPGTAPTTAATETTTLSTTVSSTTTIAPITTTTEKQIDDYRIPEQYLKSQKDDSNILETVLKNAMDDFANILMKSPEKVNRHNDMSRSFRRSNKARTVPKFGIVPIPDAMAHKLMLQLRTMKNVDVKPRRLRPLKVS